MTHEIKGVIYCITNKVNGKQYVGQTITNIDNRFAKHTRDAYKEKRNSALCQAIRKYGKSSFHIFKLEDVYINDLNKKEAEWIETLNTYNNGYNRLKRSNHDRDEIESIIEDFINGKTQVYIQKQYNICRKTLKGLLENNGLNPKKNHKHYFENWKEKEIIKLYKQGKSIREISNEIHSCRKTISKIIKNNNLKVLKGSPNKYKHPYKMASPKQ